MKGWMILLILLLASSSFLLLQIVYLHGLDARVSIISSRLRFLPGLHSREHSIGWVTLKSFLSLAEKHGLFVFVIDPHLLKILISDVVSTPSYDNCQVVCSRTQFFLGVMESSWLQHASFTAQAKQHGFQLSCSEGQDPRAISVNSFSSKDITLRCQIVYGGTVELHLIVFYKRHSYLWHGPLINEIQGLGTVKAGAYDSFLLADKNIDGIPLKAPQDVKHFLSTMNQSNFLECDLRQARRFHASYEQDMSAEAMQFRQQARQLVGVAKLALDELGVRFWLSSGTCLGWFRQCGLIPHSKDVDFGIWIKDYNPRLVAEFEKRGLMLKHLFGKVEDSFELSFRTADHDVKLDIFFFYEEEDYMWNGGTQARTGRKFKYIFPKFSLCWTEFLEMKVRVPCPPRPYIEANYGINWYMPVKEWNWKQSPPNVRENGAWDEKDWDQVIQLYE